MIEPRFSNGDEVFFIENTVIFVPKYIIKKGIIKETNIKIVDHKTQVRYKIFWREDGVPFMTECNALEVFKNIDELLTFLRNTYKQ